MRRVEVRSPSFPAVEPQTSLPAAAGKIWQALCGDAGHWRAGLYSPANTCLAECQELERHDCPELFVLVEGELTLVLSEQGQVRELPLRPFEPVLVTVPHSGYCPRGAHSGRAFVVERDAFCTEYRNRGEW